MPNPEWRPFTASVSKMGRNSGSTPDKNEYQCSQQALKMMFGIISSFYKYLLQDEIVSNIPVLLLRQKSKFICKEAATLIIRRLSDKQWQTVIIRLTQARTKENSQEERAVYILSCLYSMYLRISELVTSSRWSPTIGDFFKDNEGNWWFQTVGKGNKARQIAVSDAMLAALKHHYRTEYLNLSPYPFTGDKSPLIIVMSIMPMRS